MLRFSSKPDFFFLDSCPGDSVCLLETFARANEFALCEEHTVGIRTLPLAFLFCVREVHPSLNAAGLLPPSLTLQLSALVSWR